MEPSTLGSTRRSATVAMEEPDATSDADKVSRERNPPVPITKRDGDVSEPTQKSSDTPLSVASTGDLQ